MADGPDSFESLQISFLHSLRNESHIHMPKEVSPVSIGRDNSSTFLSPVLEGKETVVGQQSSIRVSVNGKDAALVFWAMIFGQGPAR